ncbi:hypothetical protein H1S01_11250 [Heliobacterium chlorum]|uniref:Lipoprotein n=1 Tax=Heliobacterium chlorum TaxID=2698 RepID=A0ABR7T2U2_HELCL|nr:hypothetical protein [Heliobacterium chlorum]MBC9785084.1 hypothetical protein [Heliobacterium chlorum]
MKHRVTLSTFLILLVILMMGCNSQDQLTQREIPKPPQPTVTYEGNVVPVAQGTFGWTNVQADYPSPTEIAKYIESVTVKPGAKLKVSFDDKPSDISVNHWNNSHESVKYNIENDTITVPKEEGSYIFEIYCWWMDGDSSYVLKVDVKK